MASTVNAPLPEQHLPHPMKADHGLCEKQLLSVRQLTGDIEVVTCVVCLKLLLETLHLQQGVVFRTLLQMLAKR
jgi:hypothetical protein